MVRTSERAEPAMRRGLKLPRSMQRLGRTDLIQLALGVVLGVSLFLPWYGTSDNPNANIDGKRGDLTGWQVHPVLRWVLLAAVLAAVLSAWQTIRAQRTELRRGEMATIGAVIVFGLVVFVGVLDRPGGPSGTIDLEFGWFLALAGALGAVATALARVPGGAQHVE
jgi:4-amino-4-deoxy-L-arabinose transferase-like glycosyltransferase